MLRVPAFLIVAFIVFLNCSISADPDSSPPLDLGTLSGEWEGEGEILIPKTSIPISIEGKAVFTYDSTTGRLRTALEASRFFFTYADSGYLYYSGSADSVTWEVWDGFGKYCYYQGRVQGEKITAVYNKEGKVYRVAIDFITADSLSFGLTTTYPNGKTRKRATIDLWRIK